MLNRVVVLVALMLATSANVFAKGDAAAGQARSNICTNCHGTNGVSPTDAWPNLAGQGDTYLVAQLKAFRDDTRTNLLMQQLAKTLSEQDIDNLAAYYSSLKLGGVAAPVATPVGVPVAHPPIIASPEFVVPRPHLTRQYWADKLPEDDARALVVQKCSLCHDLQRAVAFARTADRWSNVVDAMLNRGSPISAEEKPIIVNYLAKYFGPDSPSIPEVGMKPCKPSDWPRGSKDFRKNWKGSYNIWLSNQQGGNIDIVDSVTNKMVNRIGCVSAPDRVEFSKDGNTAYAPDRVEHNITVIDTRTGAIKAKIPLIDRPNTSVLSRDYKKLYIGIWPLGADEATRGYVQVLDTKTLKIIKTINTQGGIHDPWMSRDGKILLAMSPRGKFINVYDTEHDDKLLYTCCTWSEIGTMNVEAAPDGSTSRFFVSYSGLYGMAVIDAKTGKELERVEHPLDTEGPYKGVRHQAQLWTDSGFHGGEISPDGKTYWVMQRSFVYKYELPSLKGLGDVHLSLVDQQGNSFTPAIEGTWMTISPDGKKVYASRPGRNLMSVIDADTRKEEALIPTGEYPLHISIWPRGTP